MASRPIAPPAGLDDSKPMVPRLARKDDIAQDLGADVLAVRPFAQGRQSCLRLIDMADGRRLILKEDNPLSATIAGGVETEGWMLHYLQQRTALPVPRVVKVGDGRLYTDYIAEGGPLDRDAVRDLAHHLLHLHDITATDYGLARDTAFAGMTQSNKKTQDWIAFFRDRRLLHAARTALDAGAITTDLMQRIDRLAGRLDKLVTPPERPALIHGGVWAGNVLARRGKVRALIDPALYYADREMELAFIGLFCPFGPDFLTAYSARHPLRDVFFTVHKDLYNLYPLLVHARFYGKGYLPEIHRILERFA